MHEGSAVDFMEDEQGEVTIGIAETEGLEIEEEELVDTSKKRKGSEKIEERLKELRKVKRVKI